MGNEFVEQYPGRAERAADTIADAARERLRRGPDAIAALAARHLRETRERMVDNCYVLAARAAGRGRDSEARAWHRLIQALVISLDDSA